MASLPLSFFKSRGLRKDVGSPETAALCEKKWGHGGRAETVVAGDHLLQGVSQVNMTLQLVHQMKSLSVGYVPCNFLYLENILVLSLGSRIPC